jgi:hypothetical protein
VSSAATTLYIASQRVFIVVSVHFVIDSVRKLLDTPSWSCLVETKDTSHRPAAERWTELGYRVKVAHQQSFQRILGRNLCAKKMGHLAPIFTGCNVFMIKARGFSEFHN